MEGSQVEGSERRSEKRKRGGDDDPDDTDDDDDRVWLRVPKDILDPLDLDD